MMTGEIKRKKCCGRLTLLYKRKEEQYCCRCHQSYNLEGKNKGYFGSGLSKGDYEKKYYNHQA